MRAHISATIIIEDDDGLSADLIDLEDGPTCAIYVMGSGADAASIHVHPSVLPVLIEKLVRVQELFNDRPA